MHHSSPHSSGSKPPSTRRSKQRRVVKKRKIVASPSPIPSQPRKTSQTNRAIAHNLHNQSTESSKRRKKVSFQRRASDLLLATTALTRSCLSTSLSKVHITFDSHTLAPVGYQYHHRQKQYQLALPSLFSHPNQQQLSTIHSSTATAVQLAPDITAIPLASLNLQSPHYLKKFRSNHAVRSIFRHTKPARWDKPFNWSATVPPEQPVPITVQRKIAESGMTIEKLVDQYGTRGVRYYLGISAFSMTVVWSLFHVSPTLDPIALIHWLQDLQISKKGILMPKTLKDLADHPVFVEFIFTYIVVRFLHPARVVLAATLANYFNEKALFTEVQVANILDQETDPIQQYERIQHLMHYTRHEYDKHDQYQSLSLKELFDITDIQPIPDLHAFDFVDPRMKNRNTTDKHPVDYIGPKASTNQQIRFFNRTGLPLGTLAKEGTKPIVKEYADPDDPARIEYIVVRMTRIDGAEIESIRSTSRNRTSVHIWTPPDPTTGVEYQRADMRFGPNSKLGLREKAKREFIRRNGKWSILGFNTEHGQVYPEFKAAYEDFWQPIILPQTYYDQDDVEWYRYHRHPALNFGGDAQSVNPMGFAAREKLLAEQRELQKAEDSLHPFHKMMLEDAMGLANSVNSLSKSLVDIENRENSGTFDATLSALNQSSKAPGTGRRRRKSAEEIVESMIPVDPRTGSRSGYIFREDPSTHFARENTFDWIENFHKKNVKDKEANPTLVAPDGSRIPLTPTEYEVQLDKAIGIDHTPREIRRQLQYTHQYFTKAAESDEMIRNQLEFIQYALDTKDQLLNSEKVLDTAQHSNEKLNQIGVNDILRTKNRDSLTRFNRLKQQTSWSTLSRPPIVYSNPIVNDLYSSSSQQQQQQHQQGPPSITSLHGINPLDIINSYHTNTLGVTAEPIQDLSHIISSPYPTPIYSPHFSSSRGTSSHFPPHPTHQSQQELHPPLTANQLAAQHDEEQHFYNQGSPDETDLSLPRIHYPAAPVLIKPVLNPQLQSYQINPSSRQVYFSLDQNTPLHENANASQVPPNPSPPLPPPEDEHLQEMQRLQLTIDAILQDDLTAAAFDLHHITSSSTPSNFRILAQEQLQVYRQQYEFERAQFTKKHYDSDSLLQLENQRSLQDMNDAENATQHHDIIKSDQQQQQQQQGDNKLPQYFSNFAEYLREQGRKQINERYVILKYTQQKQQREVEQAKLRLAKVSHLVASKSDPNSTPEQIKRASDAFDADILADLQTDEQLHKIKILDKELAQFQATGDLSDPFFDVLLKKSQTLTSQHPERQKNDDIINNFTITVMSNMPRGKPFTIRDPKIDPLTGLPKSIQASIDEIYREQFGMTDVLKELDALTAEVEEHDKKQDEMDIDDYYLENRQYTARINAIGKKLQDAMISGVAIQHQSQQVGEDSQSPDSHLESFLFGNTNNSSKANKQLREEANLLKTAGDLAKMSPQERIEHDLKYIRKDLLRLRETLSYNYNIDQNVVDLEQLRNKPLYSAIPHHTPTDYYYYADKTTLTPLNAVHRQNEHSSVDAQKNYESEVFANILNEFVHDSFPNQLDHLVHGQTFETKPTPQQREALQRQQKQHPTGMTYSQSLPPTLLGGVSEYHHQLAAHNQHNQQVRDAAQSNFAPLDHPPADSGIHSTIGPGFQQTLPQPLRPSPLAEIVSPISPTLLTPFQASYFDNLINPELGKQTVDDAISDNLTSQAALTSTEKIDLRNKEYPTEVPKAIFDRVAAFRRHLSRVVMREFSKYEREQDMLNDPDKYFLERAERRAKGEKVSDGEEKSDDFDEFGDLKENRKQKSSWAEARKIAKEGEGIHENLERYRSQLQSETFRRQLLDLNELKTLSVLRYVDYDPANPETSLEVLNNIVPEKELIEYQPDAFIDKQVALAPKQTWFNQIRPGADLKEQYQTARDNAILDLKRNNESGDPPPDAYKYRLFVPGIDDQPYADLLTEQQRAEKVLKRYIAIKTEAQKLLNDGQHEKDPYGLVPLKDKPELEKMTKDKQAILYEQLTNQFPDASYVFTEAAFYTAQGSSGQYSGITTLWKRGEKGHKGDPALPNWTTEQMLRDQFEVNWVDDLFDNDVATHEQEWIRLHLKPYINESKDIQAQRLKRLEAEAQSMPTEQLEDEVAQLQLKERYHDETRQDGTIVFDPKTNRYDFADGRISRWQQMTTDQQTSQFFGDGSVDGIDIGLGKARPLPEKINNLARNVKHKIDRAQSQLKNFKQFNQPDISKTEHRRQAKQFDKDVADSLLQTELIAKSPIVRNIPLEYGTWRHDREITAVESTLLNFQRHSAQKLDPTIANAIDRIEPKHAGQAPDSIDSRLQDDALRFRSSRKDLKDYIEKKNEETLKKQRKLDELYGRNPNPLNISELGPDGTPDPNKLLDEPHEWDDGRTPRERFDKIHPDGTNHNWKDHNNNLNPYRPPSARHEYERINAVGQVIGRDVNHERYHLDADHPTWPQGDEKVKRPPYNKDFPWRWDLTPDDELMTDDEWIDPDPNPYFIPVNPNQLQLRRPKRVPYDVWNDMSRAEKKYNIYIALRDKYHPRPRPVMPGEPYPTALKTSYFNEQKPIFFDSGNFDSELSEQNEVDEQHLAMDSTLIPLYHKRVWEWWMQTDLPYPKLSLMEDPFQRRLKINPNLPYENHYFEKLEAERPFWTLDIAQLPKPNLPPNRIHDYDHPEYRRFAHRITKMAEIQQMILYQTMKLFFKNRYVMKGRSGFYVQTALRRDMLEYFLKMRVYQRDMKEWERAQHLIEIREQQSSDKEVQKARDQSDIEDLIFTTDVQPILPAPKPTKSFDQIYQYP